MSTRREFIALAGASMVALPLGARAQQAQPLPKRRDGKPWLIAALVGQTHAQSDIELMGPFRKGLANLGYVEGRDYKVEARYTDGDATRLPAFAKELVGLAPDLIVTFNGTAAMAFQELTKSIPIVASNLDAGAKLDLLIGKSVAHPVGNITGMTSATIDLIGKYCELAFELVPGASRIGLIVNSRQDVADRAASERKQIASASTAYKFTPVIVDVTRVEEVATAFRALADARVDFVILGANLVFGDRLAVTQGAAAVKLPAIYNQPAFVEAGGLISYGDDRRVTSARLASLVDPILRGAKPADIPVEQESTFAMAINLKTAKALGFIIPSTVLFRADEVIE